MEGLICNLKWASAGRKACSVSIIISKKTSMSNIDQNETYLVILAFQNCSSSPIKNRIFNNVDFIYAPYVT